VVRRPGQTRKKPKDLSAREREERGRGEGGGLYVVYMCEQGGGGKKSAGSEALSLMSRLREREYYRTTDVL
jgi:hypothetical protein